jgi:hypothetical protein
MADPTTALESLTNQTIQSRARTETGGSNVWLVNWLASGNGSIPAWWSPSRDRALRSFWQESDHLSGAIATFEARMTSIPFKIVARDPSIKSHVKLAARMTDDLYASADFYNGWTRFFAKFIEDLLTQDNGAFAEIIGDGPKDGPIIGRPLSVAHLDSARCQRTGNAIYPVLYRDVDGKTYKLHYSRVMFFSQMESTIAEMYGVGFCAVSRCLNIAQNLIDIVRYKQEKLGSRPHRGIIITKGGLDPADIQVAFQLAESAADDASLSRYSKVVVGGSATLPEASLELVELSGLPEGFNEEQSITYGMATIALALGLDPRELFPNLSSGSTRADALLQHLKQRGKGPGQVIHDTERQFDFKYLPTYLRFVFDYQDDAQDRQEAEIRRLRADTRRQDASSKMLDSRAMREVMVRDGDLTEEEFERMELIDGRTLEGAPILALFYSDDKELSGMLDLGVDDPVDIANNEPEMMLELIREALADTVKFLVNARDPLTTKNAFRAILALSHLEKAYLTNNLSPLATNYAEQQELLMQQMQAVPPGQPGKKPSGGLEVDKLRKVSPVSPIDSAASGSSGKNEFKPTGDDGAAKQAGESFGAAKEQPSAKQASESTRTEPLGAAKQASELAIDVEAFMRP